MTIPKWKRRTVSGLTAFLFFISSLAPAGLSAGQGSSPSHPVAAWLEQFPEELALLREMETGKDSQRPFVIYLQDAHSNPSAQKNISEILRLIYEKYPDAQIGVEAAKGPLAPQIYDLFPQFPEANEAMVQDLWQKGELTGSELFAWQAYLKKQSPKVFGVENPDLYRENLKIYRDLLFSREEIDFLLNEIHGRLMWDLSRMANNDLKQFVRERDRRKQGRFQGISFEENANMAAYISYLLAQVKKHLDIDLTDPVEQLRFPQVIRMLYLQEAHKVMDVEQTVQDWQNILREMKAQSRTEADKAVVQTLDFFARRQGIFEMGQGRSWGRDFKAGMTGLYPRRLLERVFLFAQNKKNFDPNRFSHFINSFRVFVFNAELESEFLFEELERLEKAALDKLAAKPEEKDLVRKIDHYELAEKLLHAELSKAELHKVDQEIGAFAGLFELLGVSKKEVLESYARKARHFYETAQDRDRTFVENLLAEGTAKSPQVYVLVTGGFHTDGIQDLLAERGLGYAVLTPRILDPSQSRLYLKVMGDQNVDLTTYFRDKNPFPTKREGLFFYEMLEVAAPLLMNRRGVEPSQMPGLLKSAVENHPVLGAALRAKLIEGEGVSRVRFVPKISPELSFAGRTTIGAAVNASPEYLGFAASEVRTIGAVEISFSAAGISAEVRAAAQELQMGQVRIKAGALTPEQLQQGLRSEARYETDAAVVLELFKFSRDSAQESRGLTGPAAALRNFQQQKISELETLLQKLYGQGVSLDQVVRKIRTSRPEARKELLGAFPEKINPITAGPALQRLIDQKGWEGLSNDPLRNFFLEILGIRKQELFKKLDRGIQTLEGWIRVFDAFAVSAAQPAAKEPAAAPREKHQPVAKSEARVISPVQKLLESTSRTVEFKQKIIQDFDNRASTKAPVIPPAALIQGAQALNSVFPAHRSLQGVASVLDALNVRASAGSLEDQAASLFDEILGPLNFLSRADEEPVYLSVPEAQGRSAKKILRDYRLAQFILGWADRIHKGSVRVVLVIDFSKTQAEGLQKQFDNRAAKMGVSSQVIRVVGAGSRVALDIPKLAADPHFKKHLKGIPLLPQIDKINIVSGVVQLDRQGLDPSTALLVGPSLLRLYGAAWIQEITQGPVSMRSKLRGLGINASGLNARYSQLMRAIQALAKAA